MPKWNEPCDHRKNSHQCPECHEHLRCPHGKKKDGGYRAKAKCLKCSAGTASVCKHGKWKWNCVECGNRQCPHTPGRHKSNCIICTPSRACPHKAGRRKTNCLLCTPSQRCPHVEKCLPVWTSPNVFIISSGRANVSCAPRIWRAKPILLSTCGQSVQTTSG